jgi:hypothetical protein
VLTALGKNPSPFGRATPVNDSTAADKKLLERKSLRETIDDFENQLEFLADGLLDSLDDKQAEIPVKTEHKPAVQIRKAASTYPPKLSV